MILVKIIWDTAGNVELGKVHEYSFATKAEKDAFLKGAVEGCVFPSDVRFILTDASLQNPGPARSYIAVNDRGDILGTTSNHFRAEKTMKAYMDGARAAIGWPEWCLEKDYPRVKKLLDKIPVRQNTTFYINSNGDPSVGIPSSQAT